MGRVENGSHTKGCFLCKLAFFSAEEWFWRKGKSVSVTGTSFADRLTELCLIDSYCASETHNFPMTSPVALRQVMWPRRKPWQSMGLSVLELFVAAGSRTNPALQSGSSTSSSFWRRGRSGTCEDDSGFFGCSRILQFWPPRSRPKKVPQEAATRETKTVRQRSWMLWYFCAQLSLEVF